MSQRVASIFADIGLDDSKFTKGAKGVLNGLGDIKGSFGKLPGILGVATVAFGMVVNQLNKMEQAAVADAKESAKLEAVLKSTGGAAGMNVKELNDMSDAMSRQAGIDDELIVSGQAVMLTFTKIGKEVFPEAMQSAVDMAAVLGGDLQGKVTMIGKAMNDFTGYTALKRAGVSFTESQIEQINHFKETNDLIGYQQLLLTELQTEYGGAAAAINEAGDGSENLKIAAENLSEAIGENLIPTTRSWNKELTQIYENITANINVQNRERRILEDEGNMIREQSIRFEELMTYYSDLGMYGEEAYANTMKALRANDSWSASLEGIAADAKAVSEEIDNMTEANEAYIGGVKTWQGMQDNYEQSMEDNAESIADVKEELIKVGDISSFSAMKQDEITKYRGKIDDVYTSLRGLLDDKITMKDVFDMAPAEMEKAGLTNENVEKIKGLKTDLGGYTSILKELGTTPYLSADQKVQILELQGKLGDLEQDQKDIQAAAELKTNTVILGYMQEKLAADGNLTDEETEWLIGKGVEWGIYSETAVQAYKDAQAAADEFLEHRNDAEKDKIVTVTYRVRGEIEQSAYDAMAFAGQGANNPFIGLPQSNRAIGGPVTANNSYIVGESGPELFIPNISGRIIPNQQISSAQVTPAGGISSEEALVSAMLRAGLGIDYNRMGDVIVQKLQTGTFR